MTGRYFPSWFLGVIVAVLLVAIWPMTRRTAGGHRMESMSETEELAKDLQTMQSTAGQDLASTQGLAEAVRSLQRPLNDLEVDPFFLAAARAEAAETSESSRTEQEPQIDTEDIHTFHKQDEWPELVLSGIVLGGRGSSAIINGEVHALGSIVEGLHVAEIGEHGVVLASPEGEQRVLLLKGWEQREENK